MKKFSAIIILCILGYACKPGIPDHIIQPDKMEKILFDIHVVDGYIGVMSRQDTARIVASTYYKGVFKKFDIDSVSYNKSMNYYYSQPEILDKIYDNLAKVLTKEKDQEMKRRDEADKLLMQRNVQQQVKYLTISKPDSNEVKPVIKTNPFELNTGFNR